MGGDLTYQQGGEGCVFTLSLPLDTSSVSVAPAVEVGAVLE